MISNFQYEPVGSRRGVVLKPPNLEILQESGDDKPKTFIKEKMDELRKKRDEEK